MPETGDRIDFRAIVEGVDLRGLVVASRGQPGKQGRWLCPFHNDRHNPNLAISRDGRKFKCWTCRAEGDALDWIMKLENVDVVEAARRLDPTAIPGPRADRPPLPRPEPRPAGPKAAEVEPWRDAAWQAAADELVIRAEARLWSDEGRDALGWLRRRGLADHTIRMFRLGFVASAERSAPIEALDNRPIRAARGITLPWIAPGSWYGPRQTPEDEAGRPIPRWCGVNVRRLRPDIGEPWDGPDKCLALLGSRRGYLYPYDDPTPDHPCLIAEGEIDALTAFQEIGHVVDVATTGATMQPPRAEALDALSACWAWLIATDYDEAGNEGAEKWRSRCPGKARRLRLPSGKDLNAFHAAGGDLRSWLADELARLGISKRENKTAPDGGGEPA